MNPEQIPTPRTDAVADSPDHIGGRITYALRMHKHAETLEKQLHVAREALERVRSGMNGVLDCEDIARKALAQIDEIGATHE